ncbi:MAG: efflux transporter outer membrane subunit [Pseudomonadota bacterium]
MTRTRWTLHAAAVATLAGTLAAGCATAPDATPPALRAHAWHAPLPHGGDAAALRDWWSRFDDPLLPALIDQTQRTSPTLAQAAARLAQARAGLRQARSALWPSLDASLSAGRQRNELQAPVPFSTAGVTGQLGWEIDLFGGVRHGMAAAEARAEGSALAWHDARVSLAAETASLYIGYRACEALAALYAEDARSQGRNADLTRAKVNAGFDAPAVGALATAGAAEAATRLVAQRAECDAAVKAMVALTGLQEPALRQRLGERAARLPLPAAFAVQTLPAQTLAQRPDIAAAERELRAAAGDVGVADALRYPRLLLGGSIGRSAVRSGDVTTEGTSWSIGPQVDIPLFDAGRRRAGLDAAKARFDEARAAYEQRVRQAVREVEEALVRLDAAERRQADAERAAQGYREHFAAAQKRWEVGAGSLIDMEDARRLALNAQAVLVGVQRERVAAWVALYRAVGGGWEPAAEDMKVAR